MGNNSWLLALLGAAGFVAYVAYLTAEDDKEEGGGASGMDKTKLLSMWTAIVKNMEVHKGQVVQVLRQQRAHLSDQGMHMTDEQFDATYKQHFEEILETVQSHVLQHYGLTEEELEEVTMQYSSDPEISAVVAELENLYLVDINEGQGEEPAIDLAKLEALIYEAYGTAYADAYRAVFMDFQAQDKDVQANEAEFRTKASLLAQMNLDRLLDGTGLTEKSFTQLLLRHQTEPRIYMALQSSQTQQAEALRDLGLEYLLG